MSFKTDLGFLKTQVDLLKIETECVAVALEGDMGVEYVMENMDDISSRMEELQGYGRFLYRLGSRKNIIFSLLDNRAQSTHGGQKKRPFGLVRLCECYLL